MQVIANGTTEQTDWRSVDWRKAERAVRNLRERIFKATKEGDYRKVRSLQKLLLRSHSNTLLSVRRVTQQNAGKKTPGVDKVVVKTPEARARLVDQLAEAQPWRASPTRRVYIPKANGKQRPLGIPTVRDRALQARVKNALEPEWEAQFEVTSYGFRPGRSAHDAIEAIWLTTSKGRKVWVVDADIKGAFDNIDHDHLLTMIQNFPARGLVKQWLKAGYMEGNVKHDTPAGTPQGGVVSPLLANIALHGMEEALGVRREKWSGYVKNSPRSVVRYADDFVVLCESEEDAHAAKAELREWLAERGLELSEDKTRVVHLDEGFDFLGFNIRRYPVTTKKTAKKKQLSPGHKVLIKPSKESVKRFKGKVKETFMAYKGAPPAVLIDRMNSLITGWGNYYQKAVSKRVFQKLDHYIFTRQVRWVKFRHHNKGWNWVRDRYFGRFAPTHDDIWVFGDKDTGKYMRRLSWIKIERHAMVKGASSPDDPTLRTYWAKRQGRLLSYTGQYRTLAKRQSYKCPVCTGYLSNGEEIQLHHLITDRSDARRDKPEYQQLVHYFCHQQQHGAKGATVEKSVIRRETPFEPDALKGARPVLRGGRRGNVPALPN